MSLLSTRSPWLPLILIVIATILTYAPAILDGGFVWDDDDYVTKNELLDAEDGLSRIWFEPKASPQYYPLVFTSFRLERQIAGTKAWLHHLTNVLLHAANAFLLYILARRFKLRGALIMALLFALHPVHTESVAWITERKNVLSGFFYLLAFLFYWRASEGEGLKGRGYALSIVAFSLALFSKTVTCSLGPVLLLVRWWQDGRIRKRDWLSVAPFFVLGALGAAMTASTEVAHVGAEGAEWSWSFAERLLIAGRSLYFYMGKLLLPVQLSFNYAQWDVDVGKLSAWLFPLSVVAVLVTLILPATTKRIGRGPATACLFFAGTLFPALGFFNIYPMRYYFVADHYQYLASLGLLIPLGYWIARLKPTVGKSLAIGLLLILAALSFKRTEIYEGPESLWRDTLKKNESSWLALNNLAMMQYQEKNNEEARMLMDRSLRAAPNRKEVLNNAGQLAADLDGDAEAACDLFRRALELDPKFLEARSNLALMLVRAGDNEGAIRECDQALADAKEADKEYPLARFVRARALFNLGRLNEALIDVDLVRIFLGSIPDLMQLRSEILEAEAERRR